MPEFSQDSWGDLRQRHAQDDAGEPYAIQDKLPRIS
jgi:hypothetical protein